MTELFAWMRERFRLSLYAPLVLLLETARLALASRPGESVARRVALALLALFALRLWDDLASARRDARDHPERVLSRAPVRGPFIAAAIAAGAGALALAAPSPARLAILGGLGAYHAALYAYDAKLEQRGLGASFAVLLKYPVLAALLAAGEGVATARGVVTLVTLLASFCVYEVVHDASLRQLPGAQGALQAAAVVAIVGGLALAGLAVSHGLATSIAQGTLAVASGAALVAVVRATSPQRGAGALRWLVFVMVAAELGFVATWRS